MHLTFGFLTIVSLLPSEIFSLNGEPETPKGWGKWSKWSKCKDCTRRRHRICVSKGDECTAGDVDYGTKKCTTSCQTQAQWGEWVTMVPCTKTCGGGQEWKFRHCLSQVGRCHGLPFTQVKCNSQSCPVHGQWSGYSQWSSCDKSCGGGNRKRTRSCNNPKPSNGGKTCTGSAVDISNCPVLHCPVHGQWGNFSEWSLCDRSCGGGSRLRTRLCNDPQPRNGGNHCQGLAIETSSCSVNHCSVHGGWTDWSAWSSCDKLCGGGKQLRKRHCTNPSPKLNGRDCQGLADEKKSCSPHPCPVHGGVTDWSEWTKCDRSCGGGHHSRTRSCANPRPQNGGDNCRGLLFQSASCSANPCPMHGMWGDWSGWTLCSPLCGRGIRKKTRSCNAPSPSNGGNECPGVDSQDGYCSNSPCPVDGGWRDWSEWTQCDKSCGGGRRKRTRSCTNPRPQNGGKSCQGSSVQSGSCSADRCPVHGGWSDWSARSSCSASCGPATQTRTRSCNAPSPSNGGRKCPGNTAESKDCSKQCPVHGVWTAWHPGTCTQSCGKGTQKMTRYCSNPTPSHGGRFCYGPSSKFTSCCLGNCPYGRQAYTGSYSAILYRQASHPVYRKCGWLWRSRCLRHTTYSGVSYYVKKYGTRYRSVPGETCS